MITTNLKDKLNKIDGTLQASKVIKDSDGKQINITYVKKGITWNALEGL